MNLYDKNGREIAVGDVLKVYYFTSARGKRYWMYKHVIGRDALPSGTEFLRLSHLQRAAGFYSEVIDGRHLLDVEIVQGYGCGPQPVHFERRPKHPRT